MKINQKFAKRAMVAASLTAGVMGFSSMFNEAQATGWVGGTLGGTANIIWCTGAATNCSYQN